MVPTLVISGPVGVGKSAVAMELSVLLEADNVPHTIVDLDALTMTFPRPRHDPFGTTLAIRNLADVWKNSRAAGSRNLVIARVVEGAAQLEGVRQAVPGCEVTLATLSASDEELRTRVRSREIGSLLTWHEDRSLHLAKALQDVPSDVVLDTTGLTVTQVASRLRSVCDWVT